MFYSIKNTGMIRTLFDLLCLELLSKLFRSIFLSNEMTYYAISAYEATWSQTFSHIDV